MLRAFAPRVSLLARLSRSPGVMQRHSVRFASSNGIDVLLEIRNEGKSRNWENVLALASSQPLHELLDTCIEDVQHKFMKITSKLSHSTRPFASTELQEHAFTTLLEAHSRTSGPAQHEDSTKNGQISWAMLELTRTNPYLAVVVGVPRLVRLAHKLPTNHSAEYPTQKRAGLFSKEEALLHILTSWFYHATDLASSDFLLYGLDNATFSLIELHKESDGRKREEPVPDKHSKPSRRNRSMRKATRRAVSFYIALLQRIKAEDDEVCGGENTGSRSSNMAMRMAHIAFANGRNSFAIDLIEGSIAEGVLDLHRLDLEVSYLTNEDDPFALPWWASRSLLLKLWQYGCKDNTTASIRLRSRIISILHALKCKEEVSKLVSPDLKMNRATKLFTVLKPFPMLPLVPMTETDAPREGLLHGTEAFNAAITSISQIPGVEASAIWDMVKCMRAEAEHAKSAGLLTESNSDGANIEFGPNQQTYLEITRNARSDKKHYHGIWKRLPRELERDRIPVHRMQLVAWSNFAVNAGDFPLTASIIQLAHEMCKVPGRGSLAADIYHSTKNKDSESVHAMPWQPITSVEQKDYGSSLQMTEVSIPFPEPGPVASPPSGHSKASEVPSVQDISFLFNNAIRCAHRTKRFEDCIKMMSYMFKDLNLIPDADALDFTMEAMILTKKNEDALKLFAAMHSKFGVERDIRHGYHLINALAKLGRLQDAYKALKHIDLAKNALFDGRSSLEGADLEDSDVRSHVEDDVDDGADNSDRPSNRFERRAYHWARKGVYRYAYTNILETAFRQYYNNYSKSSEEYRPSGSFSNEDGHIFSSVNTTELIRVIVGTTRLALHDADIERKLYRQRPKSSTDMRTAFTRQVGPGKEYLDVQLVDLMRRMCFYKLEKLDPIFTALREAAASEEKEDVKRMEAFIDAVRGGSVEEVEQNRLESILRKERYKKSPKSLIK